MLKWLKRIALLLLVVVLLAFAIGWWLMRGSLPKLEGDLALYGLSAPVSVQRDALGVVTIDAANETDMARALGYVHAQERYFEMDLMRRTSAGELAELFGPIAVDLDKQRRVHRMRSRVMANLDAFAGDKLAQLQAYTDGVNAGLSDLSVRPWPYLVLRQRPRRWELADSALTGYAMYFDLQDSHNTRELALWKIRPHVPPALFALLMHDGTEWDAPLYGVARGNASLPGPDEVDLRKLAMPETDSHARLSDKGTPGQQQLGGIRRTDRRWPRHRRRRHASGIACTEYLVPGAAALCGCARAGRESRYLRIYFAGPAGGGRRQQSAYRVGIHQQLWGLGGLGGGSRVRSRQAGMCGAHRVSRGDPGRGRTGGGFSGARNSVGADPA